MLSHSDGLALHDDGNFRWDINNQCLCEPEPMALFAPMPIVHFKPLAKKKGAADGVYQCPLYMYPVRTGSRERPSFITWVEVHSGSSDPCRYLVHV